MKEDKKEEKGKKEIPKLTRKFSYGYLASHEIKRKLRISTTVDKMKLDLFSSSNSLIDGLDYITETYNLETPIFFEITTVHKVKSIAMGESHYLFVTEGESQIYSWGDNSYGKIIFFLIKWISINVENTTLNYNTNCNFFLLLKANLE